MTRSPFYSVSLDYSVLEKQRHQVILDLLAQHHFISVSALTEQLDSSEATIRRDLIKLAKDNKLRKIHGGAEAITTQTRASAPKLNSSQFLLDKEKHKATKRLIAQKAVELCDDGDSIIINGGSSTYMMGEFLTNSHMNILTNSFYLAEDLVANSENRVTLPGGEIYRKQGIVLSSFDNDIVQYYHGSKMFMGTPGIGEYGVMESDPLLIRSEQKLHKQADELVILADSSKMGKTSNLIVAPLEKIDVLITDSRVEDAFVTMFEQADITVHVVEYCED